MRYVASLVVAGCLLQSVGSRAQENSDYAAARAQFEDPATVTPNDILAGKLWRIATATNTRIGFEATDHVRMPIAITRIPELSISTLQASLSAAVGADDRYEWRRVEDFVVVRPKGAWDDPSNPFNRHVRNVHVKYAGPAAVLDGLRDFIYTDRFAIEPRPTPLVLVSFDVRSGNVIDVLNELMVTADYLVWVASYRPIGRPADRFPLWDLSLAVYDRDHIAAGGSSHPPGKP